MDITKYIIGFIVFIGALISTYFSGKSSVKNKQNEEVVKDVENLNKIKRDTANLSTSERNKRVQKYTKRTRD